LFEIREGINNGVPTFSRVITSANILEVEAGTTGYKGGDGGHGCTTYFRIADLGGTGWDIETREDGCGCKSLEVTLYGDCELKTVIKALKFIARVLDEEQNGRSDW